VASFSLLRLYLRERARPSNDGREDAGPCESIVDVHPVTIGPPYLVTISLVGHVCCQKCRDLRRGGTRKQRMQHLVERNAITMQLPILLTQDDSAENPSSFVSKLKFMINTVCPINI
jgi:hypothetical protein